MFVHIVEGPRDVWRLWSLGIPAASPIGSSVSAKQLKLLSVFRGAKPGTSAELLREEPELDDEETGR